jgi:hypothetical protein
MSFNRYNGAPMRRLAPIDRYLDAERMDRLVNHGLALAHGLPASPLDLDRCLLTRDAIKEYFEAVWSAEPDPFTGEIDESAMRIALAEHGFFSECTFKDVWRVPAMQGRGCTLYSI